MAFWKNDDPPPPPRPDSPRMQEMLRSRQAPAVRVIDNTEVGAMNRRLDELQAEVMAMRERENTRLQASANLGDLPNPAVARANLGLGTVTSHVYNPDGSESTTIDFNTGEVIHPLALPVTYGSPHDRCILFTLTDAQTSRMARHRDIPWQQLFDELIDSKCSNAEQTTRPSPVAGRPLQLRPHREVEE